jgi:hypothetical protein
MTNKLLWLFLIASIFIIAVLSWLLFATPANAPTIESPANTGQVTPLPVPSVQQDTALRDRVLVSSPKPGSTVGKTFQIRGEAPGNWHFEASFPLKVIDPKGNTLANSYCQAQGEWMTTDQVPFLCNVSITGSYSGPATLILMKDNPSGLPEHDDSIDFQVVIQ